MDCNTVRCLVHNICMRTQHLLYSHKSQNIWTHWRLNCCFNTLSRLTIKKHKSSALLMICEGSHYWLVISPHKGSVMWQAFPWKYILLFSHHGWWENRRIYFHCLSFINTEIMHLVHTLPLQRQEPHYLTQSITWLLMTWRWQKPSNLRRQAINSHGIDLVCWYYSDLHTWWVNPLRAKFFRENINIYSHFMSFLHINKTQLVEIPTWVRQEPAYST